MSGYTKLWNCIVASSIWNENDKTRLVWITLLAICESDGIARVSVGSLSKLARVNFTATNKAIEILSSPDQDSRSDEFEGRRIEKVNGGFKILNYEKYRNSRDDNARREYMKNYMRSYRKGVNNVNINVNTCKAQLAQAEAEAEAEANKASSSLDISNLLAKNNLKPERVLFENECKRIGLDADDAWKSLERRKWLDKNGKIIKNWKKYVNSMRVGDLLP